MNASDERTILADCCEDWIIEWGGFYRSGREFRCPECATEWKKTDGDAMPIVAPTDGHSSAVRAPDQMLNSHTLRPRTDTNRTSSGAARRFFLRMAREWPRARLSVRSAVRSGRGQHSDFTVFVFRCSLKVVFARR